MSDARQNRQPMTSHLRSVPAGIALPTAEQLIKSDDVLRLKHIAVTINEQRGRLQSLYLLRPVVGCTDSLTHSLNELREVLHLRCQSLVRVIERRIHECGGIDLLLLLPDIRVKPVASKGHRRQNEASDQ